LQVAEDLRAEASALHRFLETLDEEDWRSPTLFMSWTPWDVLAHLHYFDQASLFALEDPEAFDRRRRELIEHVAAGGATTELQRAALRELDAPTLLRSWSETVEELAKSLSAASAADPRRRLPWFGPDMGIAMFTTARFMETWAHGQAIHDLKGVARTPTDRIRHVCTIGVKTFGWSFVNRGQEVPGPPPRVRLRAPSGAFWEWNESDEGEWIEGDALDFALVVTQVRNVRDTALRVQGAIASQWMEIAQCFAGAPADPPAPGVRRGA